MNDKRSVELRNVSRQSKGALARVSRKGVDRCRVHSAAVMSSTPLLFAEPPPKVVGEMADCRLRTFRRSDLPAVKRALCDPLVWRAYAPEDGSPVLPRWAMESYMVWLHEPGAFAFAMCMPDTDEVFGCVHGRRDLGAMSRSVELEIWMARSHWRSGVARHAINAFVEWLFAEQGVLRVYSQTYHPNRAAVGVMRASGFTIEARLRNAGVKDGCLMDRLVFARLNPVIETMPRAPDREPGWLQRPPAPTQARAA
jgi:[ribosomal protein S5]-alanine N-acetyltransferase